VVGIECKVAIVTLPLGGSGSMLSYEFFLKIDALRLNLLTFLQNWCPQSLETMHKLFCSFLHC